MNGLINRIVNALGPIGTGLVIDSFDLLTVGPFGIYSGAIIGIILTHFLMRNSALSKRLKIILSLLVAIYLTIPGTAILPVATVIGVIARFFNRPSKNV